jgi:hypothetical protein
MHFLYGLRPGFPAKLVATFDREEQSKAYLLWATLSRRDGAFQFEKGSALAGYHDAAQSSQPLTNEDPETVDHNPTPSML